MPAKRFLAVWSYDLYPHHLCGWVCEWLDNGRVRVEGYDSYSFKPVLLLWGDRARDFKKALEDLRVEHKVASKAFDEEWATARDNLIGEYS